MDILAEILKEEAGNFSKKYSEEDFYSLVRQLNKTKNRIRKNQILFIIKQKYSQKVWKDKKGIYHQVLC